MTPPYWLEYAESVVEALDVGPGTSVFDVGCGAGEFLQPLSDNGYAVGGIDPSAGLVARAREAMPDGDFVVGALASLSPADPWDVVISSAFDALAGPDEARGVLSRMAAKATHAIAILNLPEVSGDQGVDRRAMPAGFDRRWVLRALAEIGVTAVQFRQSPLGDPGRFDVFARV